MHVKISTKRTASGLRNKGAKPLRIMALCIFIQAITGCATHHFSLYSSEKVLYNGICNTRHPMLVFKPPSRFSVPPRLQKNERPPHENNTIIMEEENIILMDSYVSLAKWCHTLNKSGEPFSFVMIDSRSEIKSGWLGVLLSSLSCATIPFPIHGSFRCDLNVFRSLDSGASFLKHNEKELYYGGSGETYFTFFSPLGLLIPKYRKQYVIGLTDIEEVLTHFAREQFEQPFILNALSGASTTTCLDEALSKVDSRAFPISQNTFDALFQKTFNRPYDKTKAYVLKVNYQNTDAFFSEIYEAGKVIRLPGDENVEMQTKPSHLYLFTTNTTDVYYGNASGTHAFYRVNDLGDIKSLALVMSAWLIEKDGSPNVLIDEF